MINNIFADPDVPIDNNVFGKDIKPRKIKEKKKEQKIPPEIHTIEDFVIDIAYAEKIDAEHLKQSIKRWTTDLYKVESTPLSAPFLYEMLQKKNYDETLRKMYDICKNNQVVLLGDYFEPNTFAKNKGIFHHFATEGPSIHEWNSNPVVVQPGHRALFSSEILQTVQALFNTKDDSKTITEKITRFFRPAQVLVHCETAMMSDSYVSIQQHQNSEQHWFTISISPKEDIGVIIPMQRKTRCF